MFIILWNQQIPPLPQDFLPLYIIPLDSSISDFLLTIVIAHHKNISTIGTKLMENIHHLFRQKCKSDNFSLLSWEKIEETSTFSTRFWAYILLCLSNLVTSKVLFFVYSF